MSERTPRATRNAPNRKPTLQVCAFDADGAPMPRINVADAENLVACNWAVWRGKGERRHIKLTEAAPLRRMPKQQGDGTRAIRGDGTYRYGDGQLLGDPKSHREFIPLPR